MTDYGYRVVVIGPRVEQAIELAGEALAQTNPVHRMPTVFRLLCEPLAGPQERAERHRRIGVPEGVRREGGHASASGGHLQAMVELRPLVVRDAP